MICLLLAGSEVAVEPDKCGIDPSVHWTGEALGWRRLRGGTFFASLPFPLGSFPPVLLELSRSLVDEMVPSVSGYPEIGIDVDYIVREDISNDSVSSGYLTPGISLCCFSTLLCVGHPEVS